jgi:hypothetical protein
MTTATELLDPIIEDVLTRLDLLKAVHRKINANIAKIERLTEGYNAELN